MNRQKINETQLNAVSIIAITSVILIAKGDYKMNLTYTPTGSALPPELTSKKNVKEHPNNKQAGKFCHHHHQLAGEFCHHYHQLAEQL